MARLNFKRAPPELTELVADIVDSLPHFKHVDAKRVHFIFSDSRTRALAFCHAMSKRIQFALEIEPHYVIELIEKKWEKLGADDRVKVIIHELYHIPRTFSGNLRGHKKGFGSGWYRRRQVEHELFDQYVNSHPRMAPTDVRAFMLKAVSV